MSSAPRSNITGVPGWETSAEQNALKQLSQAVPENGLVVEIGAEFGMSASIFCTFVPKSVQIYSVDLFPEGVLEQHRNNLQEAGLLGRSVQIQGNSRLVYEDFEQDSIDLLFVDGDHSFEGAKADLFNWCSKVKVGGVMAVHDCACCTNRNPHVLHFDVTRAVSVWFFAQQGKWMVMDTVDTTMVFKRVE